MSALGQLLPRRYAASAFLPKAAAKLDDGVSAKGQTRTFGSVTGVDCRPLPPPLNPGNRLGHLLDRAPPYALEHCGNPCRRGAPAPTFLHKYERPSVIELAGRADFENK